MDVTDKKVFIYFIAMEGEMIICMHAIDKVFTVDAKFLVLSMINQKVC